MGELAVGEAEAIEATSARAYLHGDCLVVLIGEQVYTLPRDVAAQFAWDVCRGIEAMQR